LETRRFDALPRKKVLDRFPVNAEDAADTHRIQPPVVDQPPDRFRVHAELIRNLANTDESGFFACCRHGRGPSLARSSVSRISPANQASRIGRLLHKVCLQRPGLGALRSERLVVEPQPAAKAISARATSKARARSL